MELTSLSHFAFFGLDLLEVGTESSDQSAGPFLVQVPVDDAHSRHFSVLQLVESGKRMEMHKQEQSVPQFVGFDLLDC